MRAANDVQGRLVPPPGVLRGPADADNFRVQVGRYGERWYTDNLPADGSWPTSDATHPSVTTCKKASGSDWSYVSLGRVAAVSPKRLIDIAGYSREERLDAFNSINKHGLAAAGQRGTNVHLIAEGILYGTGDGLAADAPGVEYRGAVEAFFADHHPRLVAAEFVCMHRALNGAGYGGTCDAMIEIAGQLYVVDWKSRGADSRHGAYAEEAAQVAAYARAEYMIVEGDHGPERSPLPDIAGGLIVSIKPDGYRVYPIDLDAGFTHWTALHTWWVARQSERAAIGRQWPVRKSAGPTPASLVAPSSGHDIPPADPIGTTGSAQLEDLSVATPVATETADADSAPHLADPAPQQDPPPAAVPPTLTPADEQNAVRSRPAPVEGDDVVDPTFDVLQAAYLAVGPVGRAWITALTEQAIQGGVSFHSRGHRTQRRYSIVRGLVLLAANGGHDDDLLRAVLEPIIGDCAQFLSVAPGHLVGSLSVHEAHRFADMCDRFVEGGFLLTFDDGGAAHLREAA